MKKLMACVFTALGGLILSDAVNASIASQGYVDSVVYSLTSKQYVDLNFQSLVDKVTTTNYTRLVDRDKISKDQLYTSLEYVDAQDALFVKKTDATVVSVGGTAGTFVSGVSQSNGVLGAKAGTFVSNIGADSTSVVAPQTAAVVAFVNQKISDIGGDIGNAYQLKSEKLKSTDSDTRITENNKDDLYPSVAKTTNIVKNAILDLDAGPFGEEGSFIESVRQQDGKLNASAGTFETVINDSTKDSVVAPQTAAVVKYAEALSNKLTAAEYKGNEAPADKDRLYPSVSLTEFIAQEAAKAAIKQLQAIVNVPAKCAQAEKYCVLTTNGTDFVWEVIERSTSADHPEPSVSTDANAERMKVYTITNQ